MDTTALSLLLTALTTGAAAGLKDTANQAVKDGYGKLKLLLQKKLADSPAALVALEEHEKQPDVWKSPLATGLQTAGADQDEAIIAAARHLMHLVRLVQPQQAGVESNLVQNLGPVQGQVIENSGTITMNFGELPRT